MIGGLSLRQWSPLLPSLSSFRSTATIRFSLVPPEAIDAGVVGCEQLTSRERRQLRHERRESKAGSGGNWREEVEERLLHRPKKKRPASWTEELNLDNLSRLGFQWWLLRVSRVTGHETAAGLARSLARNFPNLEFKIYFPAVKKQRKLKNGSYTTKIKPLFPGCVFLHCILNKEIHDFIREIDGIGGFVASKVGNSKRQINKPKPVPIDEMEAIFQQAQEEQKNSDKASHEEHDKENTHNDSGNSRISNPNATSSGKLKKGLEPPEKSLLAGENNKPLVQGANIRILSGPFAEFTGCIKELNFQSGKVTVGLKLFGKESFVELTLDQVLETQQTT